MTSTATAPAPAAAPVRDLPRWRLLVRRPTFLAGVAILLLWVVAAVVGESIGHGPLTQELLSANSGPSAAHWLGTDQLGRDMLARVAAGSREILVITPLITALGTVCGTALGLAMGYYGGVFDLVAGRVVEAVLALPAVMIAFLFIVALGPSTLTLVIVIGIIFTPIIARTVRAAVLAERHLDYLDSAQLLGERSWTVMASEILPNVLPAVLVEFSVRLGYAVSAVAALSFLGFGIQPPTPDWGSDIAANYSVLAAGYWWETLFPALAIASLIVAVNLIADAAGEAMSA